MRAAGHGLTACMGFGADTAHSCCSSMRFGVVSSRGLCSSCGLPGHRGLWHAAAGSAKTSPALNAAACMRPGVWRRPARSRPSQLSPDALPCCTSARVRAQVGSQFRRFAEPAGQVQDNEWVVRGNEPTATLRFEANGGKVQPRAPGRASCGPCVSESAQALHACTPGGRHGAIRLSRSGYRALCGAC